MNMTISFLSHDELEAIHQVEEDWRKVFAIAEMQDTFPDLQVAKNDLGTLLFCTAEANKEVASFDVDVSTPDIKVWTYVALDKHERVYTSPPCFSIGTKNPAGFGIIPVAGWAESMEAAGFPTSLIRKVKSYLDSRAPVCYL